MFLEERNLMINIFLNFISNIWIYVYPVNRISKLNKSGMRLDTVPIGRDIKGFAARETLQDIQTRFE
jgi:hypothetical protein